MFHPAIASALAHERQTQMIKAVSRRRALRAAMTATCGTDWHGSDRQGRRGQ